MTIKSVVAQSARYPYGVNTYESMSTQLNDRAAKRGLSDTVMTQLRHAKENRKKKTYKLHEKSLELANQLTTMDNQLKYKK